MQANGAAVTAAITSNRPPLTLRVIDPGERVTVRLLAAQMSAHDVGLAVLGEGGADLDGWND